MDFKKEEPNVISLFHRSKRSLPLHRKRTPQKELPLPLGPPLSHPRSTAGHARRRHATVARCRRRAAQETHIYHPVIRSAFI